MRGRSVELSKSKSEGSHGEVEYVREKAGSERDQTDTRLVALVIHLSLVARDDRGMSIVCAVGVATVTLPTK